MIFLLERMTHYRNITLGLKAQYQVTLMCNVLWLNSSYRSIKDANANTVVPCSCVSACVPLESVELLLEQPEYPAVNMTKMDESPKITLFTNGYSKNASQ